MFPTDASRAYVLTDIYINTLTVTTTLYKALATSTDDVMLYRLEQVGGSPPADAPATFKEVECRLCIFDSIPAVRSYTTHG